MGCDGPRVCKQIGKPIIEPVGNAVAQHQREPVKVGKYEPERAGAVAFTFNIAKPKRVNQRFAPVNPSQHEPKYVPERQPLAFGFADALEVHEYFSIAFAKQVPFAQLVSLDVHVAIYLAFGQRVEAQVREPDEHSRVAFAIAEPKHGKVRVALEKRVAYESARIGESIEVAQPGNVRLAKPLAKRQPD